MNASFEHFSDRKSSANKRKARFDARVGLAFCPEELTPEEAAIIHATEVRSPLLTDPNYAAVLRIFPEYTGLLNVENVVAAALRTMREEVFNFYGSNPSKLLQQVKDYFRNEQELVFDGESVSQFIDEQLVGYSSEILANNALFLWFEGLYNSAALAEAEDRFAALNACDDDYRMAY